MFLSNVQSLSRQSHAKVKVQCQFAAVDNCVNVSEMRYRDAMDNIDRNNGKYMCFHCSRHIKCSGARNPNHRYEYDMNMFGNIDTDEKAYLLGWIGSDGTISKSSWSITIAIHKYDIDCLTNLRNIIGDSIPIKPKTNTDLAYFTINSKQICEDVCKHFGIKRGKKSDVIQFPHFKDDDITWAFIRGYFDGDGTIYNYNTNPTPECRISSNSNKMLTGLSAFCKIPNRIRHDTISFAGTNCMDFLDKIYKNSKLETRLPRKYQQFIDWSTWRCLIKAPGMSCRFPHCFVYKTDPNAIFPFKTNMSDVGYDISVIKVENKWHNQITLYDTGIKISMAHGYYAEVVPRSSLSKSGYILANSMGIIDPGYHGNIFVALIKVDDSAPDIQLPFRCCQIIFKPQLHFNLIEVTDDFEDTTRGDGGFGSTSIN